MTPLLPKFDRRRLLSWTRPICSIWNLSRLFPLRTKASGRIINLDAPFESPEKGKEFFASASTPSSTRRSPRAEDLARAPSIQDRRHVRRFAEQGTKAFAKPHAHLLSARKMELDAASQVGRAERGTPMHCSASSPMCASAPRAESTRARASTQGTTEGFRLHHPV